MPTLKINDQEITVEAGTLLLDACQQLGLVIPHYCYHETLTPVATCRMCQVEIKGQPKLVTSCTTMAADNMEVFTDSPAVKDARSAVMEFLLINHPLDCPICDQAGECRLQDYSYEHGSGDSRMEEPKRRYAYEDLGAGIVLDKNRCIHCTRCVRFTQEISKTHELTMVNRGAHLEVTAFDGQTLDGNPLAGNVVDLCPVGALTDRHFRFHKRVWYLKRVPSISRHSAMGNSIWAEVDENWVWRFRPRHIEGARATWFIFDEERKACERYNLDPKTRLKTPLLKGQGSSPEAISEALKACEGVAVIGQGTFGCDTAQRLGELATSENLRYGSGDLRYPLSFPELQGSGDGILNRKGFQERGFRFDALEELHEKVKTGQIQAVVCLHDEAFSSHHENELLARIIEGAPFSLVLEPIPSRLSEIATARLPLTTYLEESDFIVNHEGAIRRYQKALEAPKGVKPLTEWVKLMATQDAKCTNA